MKRFLLICGFAIATTTLAGCSSKMVSSDEYSGFLPDYSKLVEGESPSGAPTMHWIDPALDLNQYTSIYLERSQFYPRPKPTARVSQDTLDRITRYYDQALKREMSKSLPVVDTPLADSIIVKPAITAVSASDKDLAVYEVIPIALVAAAVSSASGIRDQNVTLATEAMLIDANNNKVIAEVVRKGEGKVLENDSQPITADDVKLVIDHLAEDLHNSYLTLKK